MSGFGNEVTQKLRTDIKTKLTDIGAYVDNELPDYIMVMVANQRTKYQMKDDLSLFLGKNTDEFVDWLHDILKNMQSNMMTNLELTTEGKSKKDASLESGLVDSKKEKLKKVTKKVKKLNTQEKKLNQITTTSEDTSLKHQKSLVNEEQNEIDRKKNFLKINEEEAKIDQVQINEEINIDQEVVLELKRDANDTDELLLETQEEATKVSNKQKNRKLQRTLRDRVQVSRKLRSSESTGNVPASTIGAIVNRPIEFQKNDDEEDDKVGIKNNVTSIVKVAERKSSVPLAMQASRLLVLKAVQGAHKSVSQASNQLKRKSTELDSAFHKKSRISDQSSNIKSLDPCDLRYCLEANRAQKDHLNENKYLDDRNLENEEMSEKVLVRQNPRFIVTVSGSAKSNKEIISTNNKSNTRLKPDVQDELLLDEEIEEEFREDNLETEKREKMVSNFNDVSASAKINERCKYWPSCKNGAQCLYHHPISQCRTYPNCKFGDKCLFIHPSSSYPFKNSGLSNLRTAPTTCRYFPNCFNLNCPFLHPKLCIFGIKCRNISCPFTHPPSYQLITKNLPKPQQLKWENTLQNKKLVKEKPETMPVEVEKAP